MATADVLCACAALVRNLMHYAKPCRLPLLTKDGRVALQAIQESGYFVIPQFMSESQCESIRFLIDRLFDEYKSSIWRDPVGADERFFGFDRKVSVVRDQFLRNRFINDILDYYEKSTNKVHFTMAGRIRFHPSNLGSGQGWHRDRADYKQTKAILYLSDTTEQNGPFQYIAQSHHPLQMCATRLRYGVRLGETRIADGVVNEMIARSPERLATIVGAAGTLVLADTRGIHRGAPLVSGQRYALTNYSWYDADMPGHIAALIVP